MREIGEEIVLYLRGAHKSANGSPILPFVVFGIVAVGWRIKRNGRCLGHVDDVSHAELIQFVRTQSRRSV